MSIDLTFEELDAQITQHFANQEYQQGFDLATRAGHRFPQQVNYIDYLRICLAARLNQTELVIQLLRDKLEQGVWYSERILRQSPSLQPLQGVAEFEQVVALSQQQQEQLQAQPIIVMPPASSEPTTPLLIALHSNGSNAQASADFWQAATQRGWLVALPNSSQVMWTGAYGWDDRDIAVPQVQAHYAQLCQEYAVNQERVVIAGHSLGAQLALWLALSGALKVRGAIAIGPYLPEIDSLLPLVEQNQGSKLRVQLIVGEKDNSIPHDTIQQLAEAMNSRGIVCQLDTFPNLGHDLAPEFQHNMLSALESL